MGYMLGHVPSWPHITRLVPFHRRPARVGLISNCVSVRDVVRTGSDLCCGEYSRVQQGGAARWSAQFSVVSSPVIRLAPGTLDAACW